MYPLDIKTPQKSNICVIYTLYSSIQQVSHELVSPSMLYFTFYSISQTYPSSHFVHKTISASCNPRTYDVTLSTRFFVPNYITGYSFINSFASLSPSIPNNTTGRSVPLSSIHFTKFNPSPLFSRINTTFIFTSVVILPLFYSSLPYTSAYPLHFKTTRCTIQPIRSTVVLYTLDTPLIRHHPPQNSPVYNNTLPS